MAFWLFKASSGLVLVLLLLLPASCCRPFSLDDSRGTDIGLVGGLNFLGLSLPYLILALPARHALSLGEHLSVTRVGIATVNSFHSSPTPVHRVCPVSSTEYSIELLLPSPPNGQRPTQPGREPASLVLTTKLSKPPTKFPATSPCSVRALTNQTHRCSRSTRRLQLPALGNPAFRAQRPSRDVSGPSQGSQHNRDENL